MLTWRGGSPRPPVALGLFAAVLIVVTALGWEAVAATRDQRSTAESVLEDYAMLAAEQYARNVQVTLEYEWLFPARRLLAGVRAGDDSLNPGAPLQGQRGTQPLDRAVESLFVLGGESWALDAEGNEADLSFEGIVRAHAAANRDADSNHTFVVLPEETTRRIIGYARSNDDPSSLEGFVGSADALEHFLAEAVSVYDILPATLTEDSQELVRVEVRSRDGARLYTHGPAGSAAAHADFGLPSHFDGLAVVATIPAGSAHRLVRGGVPYSRLPGVATMITVALILLLTSALLWRRERQFMRLREDFVANASHELRTPLAQIRLFSETLRLDRVRDRSERDRAVSVIDREARKLSLLVETLLQFSSASRRALPCAPEAVDAHQLALGVTEWLAPLAEARGMSLVVKGTLDAMAWADRDLLEQVLVNLLDNAVKYGAESQRITVEIEAVDDDVVISVEDQGQGVPEVEQARVWRRFWRGRRRDAVTGTGIGLALVRELVELQHGTVAVANADGAGARFSVRFPGAPR